MKCKKLRDHLALPRIMRRISTNLISLSIIASHKVQLTRVMGVALASLVILEEIRVQQRSLPKLDNGPGNSGGKVAPLEPALVTQCSRQAHAPRNIWMSQELFLFDGIVAV